MEEDTWQEGDTAVLALKTDPRSPFERGCAYRVAGVVRLAGYTGLVFDGKPAPNKWHAWDHRSFRKAREGEVLMPESQLTSLMRRGESKIIH